MVCVVECGVEIVVIECLFEFLCFLYVGVYG